MYCVCIFYDVIHELDSGMGFGVSFGVYTRMGS